MDNSEPLLDINSIQHNDILTNIITKQSYVVIRSWVWNYESVTHTETYRLGKKILPKNFVTLEIQSIDSQNTLHSALSWRITKAQKEQKSWSTQGFTKPDIFVYVVIHLGPQTNVIFYK